jgi:DNA-directed RNA polymerase specialized sigma24 family protein
MKNETERRNLFGFPQTRWSLLEKAKESEAARNLLFKLYYKPVYAFFQWLARDADIAEDLTQDFFSKEWQFRTEDEKGVVNRADSNKGKFRDFLTEALRNRWRSKIAEINRRRSQTTRPINDDAWDRLSIPRIKHAEQIFRKTQAQTIVQEALEQTKTICVARGKQQNFDLFLSRYLANSNTADDWESIGERFGLADGKTARNIADMAARHFERILRELVRTLDPASNVGDGIRDLLSDLGEDDE